MKATTWWRVARWALLLTMLVALAGGDVLDRQLVIDWANEWARAKDINPRNEDGSINIMAGINLATRAAGRSTGDKDADAALDVFLVVKKINDADKLVDEGRKNNDAAPMDQAIAARPEDWTYRSARAALALDQGDLATAQAQYPLWYANRSIDDLENATAGLTAADGPGLSGAQCHAYWERMADLWRMRYDAGHNPGDQAAAAEALSNAEVCP